VDFSFEGVALVTQLSESVDDDAENEVH
jgi:hypothetical protein